MSYDWNSGTTVSENIKELWKTLAENGIDVWVCSASATDPIRAAVDAWGLHDYVTGVLAMTNKLEDGVYINEYDYETGCGWIKDSEGKAVYGSVQPEMKDACSFCPTGMRRG